MEESERSRKERVEKAEAKLELIDFLRDNTRVEELVSSLVEALNLGIADPQFVKRNMNNLLGIVKLLKDHKTKEEEQERLNENLAFIIAIFQENVELILTEDKNVELSTEDVVIRIANVCKICSLKPPRPRKTAQAYQTKHSRLVELPPGSISFDLNNQRKLAIVIEENNIYVYQYLNEDIKWLLVGF